MLLVGSCRHVPEQMACAAPRRCQDTLSCVPSTSQALLSSSLSQQVGDSGFDVDSGPNREPGRTARESRGSGRAEGILASASFLSASQHMVSESLGASQSLRDDGERGYIENGSAGDDPASNATDEPQDGADEYEMDELNQHPITITLMRCVTQLRERNLFGAEASACGAGAQFWRRL